MPMKGSLRGKGGIAGWWSSSPSKNESPSSPRENHDRGSSTWSMQPILPQDEDCIDSPSSGKKSGWFDTINNTIKGKSKKSRKSIKDPQQYERHDSGTQSSSYNSGEAEVRHSSPIPFQPLPEIQPGDPIKSNKALEKVIAGPDGYAPSINSTKDAEQATPELATAAIEQVKEVSPLFPVRRVAPADHPSGPTDRCAPTRRYPIQNNKSFVMDDVFEDVSQYTVKMDIFSDILAENPSSTSLNVSDASVQTEHLAHLKSSSAGHVDHITGDWHSNDPAGSAIIGRGGRTVSAELRYQQDIMRQCAGTWLEAQSMLSQIQMAMGEEVARIDPRLAPGTTMADILAWPDPSAFFSERVESERLERRRQHQQLESELPCTPWLKLSKDEAISIANSVLSWKDEIEKDGVEAFVKVMRDLDGEHDLQTCPDTGPYSKHCTAEEARAVLESFKDDIRLKKRCQSLSSIAVIEDWMLQFPPDDTGAVVLEDWLLDCQIGLGDDDDDEDTFVKTHPNCRKGRADELEGKRKLGKNMTQSSERTCLRTFDKNTVEKRLLRCWLGLNENQPIPAVKTHPNRKRLSWVKRMKTMPVMKETGYRLEKTISLASRSKSMGFLVLPFRTRPLPTSSEESHAMNLPTLGDDAKAASDDSYTMIVPALSDNAKAQGLEWDVLMDESPRLEKISPFERDLLVAAEKALLPPEIATTEELDVATIGLLGNWEDSAAAKGMLAAEKTLVDAIERGAEIEDILEKGPASDTVEERLNMEEMMWFTLDRADSAAKALDLAREGLIDAMEKGSAAGSGFCYVETRMLARLEIAEYIAKRLKAVVDQQVMDESDAFIIEGYVMPVAGEAMADAHEEKPLAAVTDVADDVNQASLAILQKDEEKRRVHRNCALAEEKSL